MNLTVLPETLAVCRLPAADRIPSWALELHEGFVSVTRTPDELSIVCPQEAVPHFQAALETWPEIPSAPLLRHYLERLGSPSPAAGSATVSPDSAMPAGPDAFAAPSPE